MCKVRTVMAFGVKKGRGGYRAIKYPINHVLVLGWGGGGKGEYLYNDVKWKISYHEFVPNISVI